MIKTIVLDSTPLGLVTQRPGRPEADKCRTWVETMIQAGHHVLVPGIIDYEVVRELTRREKNSLQRLELLLSNQNRLPRGTAAEEELLRLVDEFY